MSATTAADDARRELLAHLSHELRTPLTAMCGTIEILAEELYEDLSEPLRECLDIALRNGAALRHMIEDLLDAAGNHSGALTVKPEPVDLEALLSRAVRAQHVEIAESGEGRVELHVSEGLPLVLADPERTTQILQSLLDNAIKFSPADSVVRVHAALRPDRRAVTIAVEDQGPGIDPAQAPQLFEALRQAEAEVAASRSGLGLGLYMARQLVRLHGGTIWAEPGPDGGSSFRFTLPVVDDPRE